MEKPDSKMSRIELEKSGELTWKDEKVWLEKWVGLTWKSGKAHLKSEKEWREKWEGLNQNREGPIKKHDSYDSKKEGLVDTSQPL